MHLTIVYTANFRGDLDLLPRLHTFINRLRQRAEGRVLLLDAGDACAGEAWHCQVTGGRSALLVLDAMGYHAANVNGFLTGTGREKLAGNLLKLALIDDAGGWLEDGVLVTANDDAPAQAHDLHIILTPGDETTLARKRLRLANVRQGQLGVVQVGSVDGNGRLAITHHAVETLPAGTLPDPTIAATVAFVLSEARYTQGRQGNTPG